MTMGEILVEIMATEAGQSFRAPGHLVGPFPSGAPAIFIDQVARLGREAGIIGCVGDDDFGWLNIERLRHDGVDTSAITVLKEAVTGSAFVTYDQTGERHFIFNIANSASAHLSASHVSPALLENCTHFHVMGSSLFSPGIQEAMDKAIRIVKSQGGSVSFDPNIREEMLERPGMRDALTSVLKQTDLFLPSGTELTCLLEASTEEEAIDELLALGIREIVVKKGRQGCSYYDAASRLSRPRAHGRGGRPHRRRRLLRRHLRRLPPPGHAGRGVVALRVRQRCAGGDAHRPDGGHGRVPRAGCAPGPGRFARGRRARLRLTTAAMVR